MADMHGNINVVAAELFSRLLRLPLFGLRATTELCNPQPLRQQRRRQQQQQQQQGRPLGVAGAAGHWQAGSRQAGAADSSTWAQAAKCWALRTARQVGGEAAVDALSPLLL